MLYISDSLINDGYKIDKLINRVIIDDNLDFIIYLYDKYKNEITIDIDRCLIKSAKYGSLKCIEYFTNLGGNIENGLALFETCKKKIESKNYWVIDIYNNYSKTAQFLIDKGVDICIDNNKAIRLVSVSGNSNLIRLLCNNGADFKVNNHECIRNAVIKGDIEMSKYLSSLYDFKNNYYNLFIKLLKLSCKYGHLGIFNFFFREGICENRKKYFMYLASKYGKYEIIEFLYDRGVSIQVRNNYPLLKSVDDDNYDTTKFLIEKGANINVNYIRNDENINLLKLATFNNNLIIVKYLIEKNIDKKFYKDILDFYKDNNKEIYNYINSLE